ncbi:hypothetical protein M2132_000221 [Dysgonomonas sp. PH5-45]|uniref:hypothetical protein n=1 Tax=unclassified Dysgonomonas TaxID=2630389 RepID=UPI00247704F1|nr:MULTISPECIES: hypothetical protein [unclassified Dysgonomonas]MDH6353901.1 hypothetical protein [Dysgonomonas sp. PH5-45]MDH6386803.1 hypothetical protein [Dysgonomonas sp. PH5-37]
MRAKHTVRHHFENESVSVLEIKRNLLMEKEGDQLYFWFVYEKRNDCLNPLECKLSENKSGKEYYIFEDAKLEFDNKEAIFTEGDKTHKLKVVSPTKSLPEAVKESIDDFLTALRFG